MASLTVISATLALTLLAPQANAADVSPVHQVLNMLNDMKTKGESMLAEEAEIYAAYAEWVEEQEQKLDFEAETGASDIDRFLAEAAKADNDVEKLRASIAELDTEMATAQREKSDASALRDKEHSEYVKLSTDYGESVEALKQALNTMQSKNYDVAQATSLMQSMSKSSSGMRRVLAAFLQQKEETTKGGFLQAEEVGAPAASAYEFQSGSIVQLLEKFLKKFENELEDVESEETNQARNYQLEMMHLDDDLAYLKKELEEKSLFKAKRTLDSATAKGDVVSTKKDLAEDQVTLKDMKATFSRKTDTFKVNQQVRKEEIAAISKALEIFSDAKMSITFHTKTVWKKLAHKGQGYTASFLQMNSARASVSARQRAVRFLQKKAVLLSSSVLKEVAAQAATGGFDKVINMINQLVAKLKAEAAAEADHKQWCADEAKSNKIKRSKKTSKVNKLEATLDSLTQKIASLVKKIATLSKEQADVQSAMSEATQQRQNEKAVNLETIQDAAEGKAVTQKALSVLKEYYSSQTSLLQASGGQEPEMAAYKVMGSANKGVMGLLEAVSTDFSRLQADTTAAEKAAATEYTEFMKDAKASKMAKADLERKSRIEQDQKEYEKDQTATDLANTQDELEKAVAYTSDLKPLCLEVAVSYEERVALRKQEIEALKEAYHILDQKA